MFVVVGSHFMLRIVLCLAAALLTFGIVPLSAAAGDRETCADWQSEQAVAACSRLLNQNPSDAIFHNNRGTAYWGKHDYDRAVLDYDQAIRLDPKLVVAYYGRGRAYEEKHEYDRAISNYDQAIRLDPKFANAYNDRGNSYYKGQQDYDRAISDYDQAIRLDPKFANAYNDRGNAYSGKLDYDRAISDFDQAIRFNPKYAIAYGSRGYAFEKKGDYNRAISDYDQSLKLDPNLDFARQGRERVQIALAARPNPAPRPLTPPISAERRVALVIGNSSYASSFVPALPNPRRDAGLVADALRQAGFETVQLVDLDHAGMVKALQSFRDKADSADWALVYFAGHGIEVNRVNYLIPTDAKLADSRDVKHETVSYEDVADAIGGAKALRIIVLDACRNNPFKAQMHQTAALRGSLDRGLAAPPETEAGTLVVYSAKEGQAAIDGDGINSPFALAFVARLKTPGREVQRMFDDVRDDVLKATNKRQQPYKYGSLSGERDFFFVAGK
jgi:tetratricopeptide (TPR) repeat protein